MSDRQQYDNLIWMTPGYRPRRTFVAAALALLAGLIFTCVGTPSAHAQTYTTLYTFTGGIDGAKPASPPTPDAAGNLYGTTVTGGSHGQGTVYKLSPSGTESVLHSFAGGSDGSIPYASPLIDKAGNLIVTTQSGGANNLGTLFAVAPKRAWKVLHSFSSAEGYWPSALVRDAAGNLYGTTYLGGALGLGTVFKLDRAGNETVLYNFTGGTDGSLPAGGVVRDLSGNLYGTTTGGGALGAGVVFEVDSTGTFNVIYSFAGGADGGTPSAGLVLDPAGNLYGTAIAGGASSQGVVFRIDPAQQETVLHSFDGFGGGGVPYGGLVRDPAGNLYGTTYFGGAQSEGVVYVLRPDGKFRVLHSFTNGTDGGDPTAGLLFYKGAIYGTTPYGGANLAGVVFKISLK
jgi:uncharacterized repeat protein (TIGR03803 family)